MYEANSYDFYEYIRDLGLIFLKAHNLFIQDNNLKDHLNWSLKNYRGIEKRILKEFIFENEENNQNQITGNYLKAIREIKKQIYLAIQEKDYAYFDENGEFNNIFLETNETFTGLAHIFAEEYNLNLKADFTNLKKTHNRVYH